MLVHLNLHLVRIERHVPGDDRKDLLAQHGDQVPWPQRDALMGEQDLQALARHRRRVLALEETQKVHAALRPKMRAKRRFFSPGMTMGTVSPLRRRAAS